MGWVGVNVDNARVVPDEMTRDVSIAVSVGWHLVFAYRGHRLLCRVGSRGEAVRVCLARYLESFPFSHGSSSLFRQGDTGHADTDDSSLDEGVCISCIRKIGGGTVEQEVALVVGRIDVQTANGMVDKDVTRADRNDTVGNVYIILKDGVENGNVLVRVDLISVGIDKLSHLGGEGGDSDGRLKGNDTVGVRHHNGRAIIGQSVATI